MQRRGAAVSAFGRAHDRASRAPARGPWHDQGVRQAFFGVLPFVVGALVGWSVGRRRVPAGGPAGEGGAAGVSDASNAGSATDADNETRGVDEVRYVAGLALGFSAFTTTSLLSWQNAHFALGLVAPSMLLTLLTSLCALATAWALKRDFALAGGALASNLLPLVAIMVNPPMV